MSLADDLRDAVQSYLNGERMELEALADDLPKAAADRRGPSIFSVPYYYTYAWRGLFDVSPKMLRWIAGLKTKSTKAVGCADLRTAVPLHGRRLQSWTVDGELFRAAPGSLVDEDGEPMYTIYDDILGDNIGKAGNYQLIIRAPIAGNPFFLDPEQIYKETDSEGYAYQQEIVSVDKVKGCVVCWARTTKRDERVWHPMRRAMAALDRRTKKARAR